MEIYTGLTEGEPGPIKEGMMKTLRRDYKVDIDFLKVNLLLVVRERDAD